MTQDRLDRTEALLKQVGGQVRALRKAAGLTRAALADRSSVSLRYLAQLESGQGNMSLALLDRVARAMGVELQTLLATDADDPQGETRMLTLYRNAGPETRAQVLDLLREQSGARAGRIALVGLRGAGKSTLGAAAGKWLDLPFLQLNDEIGRIAGMPVAELIALAGQDGYRRMEAQALDGVVADHERCILEVAGGVVAEPETFARLTARFHTIWIKAAPEDHMNRVRAQGDLRPMRGNPAAMDQLRDILAAREATYARALATVDTSATKASVAAERLVRTIRDLRLAPEE